MSHQHCDTLPRAQLKTPDENHRAFLRASDQAGKSVTQALIWIGISQLGAFTFAFRP
jgi:hypothetical protein